MLPSEIFGKLTLHARKSLREAGNIAAQAGSPAVAPEHLFLAIYFEKGSLGNNILEGLDLDQKQIGTLVVPRPWNPSLDSPGPVLSSELKNVITRAFSLAEKANFPYVGTEHLLYAMLDRPSPEIKKLLRRGKQERKARPNASQNTPGTDPLSALSKIFDLPELTLARKRKVRTEATPFLNQFSINLNLDAEKRGEITVGRNKEIERMITVLGRRSKNNPVLIGDPGVGKTAIVSGLAQRINRGEIPLSLSGKRILALDLALLVAGTSFRGEFESRIKEVIREASQNKDVILFIDEIHSIVGAGNANGGLDAANILKPALSRGDIQCIGATTFGEYKRYIEKDPALERRFQPVRVLEPTVLEAKEILRGIRRQYENFHNVTLSEEALEQAVELSSRYLTDRFLPDKAIDLIDETASALRNRGKHYDLLKKIRRFEKDRALATQEKNRLIGEEKYDEASFFRDQEKKMTEEIEKLMNEQREKERDNPVMIATADIARTVSQMTNIPVERIIIQRNLDLKQLEKKISGKIVGQEEALRSIGSVLTRSLSGISSPDRPLGSFLFLGPTGVGKTLTARLLAEEVFGRPEALIRIDMSEFMEKHNVARLVGAPAGYVGYEEGGKLTEKIRHQPFSVVLFDEIEKAHPDVFNLLLQILEDGSLTDAEGRKVNFKNAIILLTSNIGTREFTHSAKLGFRTGARDKSLPGREELESRVLDELRNEIKPEILNRLDHILVFSPLAPKDLEKIAKLEMEKLSARLMKQGLAISFAPAVPRFIAKESFAFEHGARLVRKHIQDWVENAIAEAIIGNRIKNGKAALAVKNGKVVID